MLESRGDFILTDRQQVARELRELVKEGATVSKSLRFIESKLNIDEPAAMVFFRATFRLGFGVAAKVAGGYPKTDRDNTQRGFATLLVLPLIVESRDQWDDADREPFGHWFDSLASNSIKAITDQARASIEGDSDWANVSDAVREQYLTAERSRLVLSEYGEIVARLAERLQSRVDELERNAEEALEAQKTHAK